MNDMMTGMMGMITPMATPGLMMGQYELQNHLLVECKERRDKLDITLWTTIAIFMLPIAIIGKYFFSMLTHTNVIFTVSWLIDLVAVGMAIMIWSVTLYYEQKDMGFFLFNEEADKRAEVRYMVNMFEDMRTGAFNYDYMLGAFTAAIWIRCIILLQLTESFGPLIVMIANMIVIVLKFLVLYLLGVLTFACVALLTLSELPAYEDLFESFRTFVNASLGSYDLYMYDGFSNWKKYYGIGLHLAVLFYNMLIVINLLIAIMSDEYGRL